MQRPWRCHRPKPRPRHRLKRQRLLRQLLLRSSPHLQHQRRLLLSLQHRLLQLLQLCQLSVSGKPPFSVRLGYARGAQVSYNGQAVNVAPFTSGETARLKLGQ